MGHGWLRESQSHSGLVAHRHKSSSLKGMHGSLNQAAAATRASLASTVSTFLRQPNLTPDSAQSWKAECIYFYRVHREQSSNAILDRCLAPNLCIIYCVDIYVSRYVSVLRTVQYLGWFHRQTRGLSGSGELPSFQFPNCTPLAVVYWLYN